MCHSRHLAVSRVRACFFLFFFRLFFVLFFLPFFSFQTCFVSRTRPQTATHGTLLLQLLGWPKTDPVRESTDSQLAARKPASKGQSGKASQGPPRDHQGPPRLGRPGRRSLCPIFPLPSSLSPLPSSLFFRLSHPFVIAAVVDPERGCSSLNAKEELPVGNPVATPWQPFGNPFSNLFGVRLCVGSRSRTPPWYQAKHAQPAGAVCPSTAGGGTT